MANFKLALSAGHCKHTAGKRCLKSLDANQTREWTLNARIAEKVEKLLADYTGWELLRVDDRTGEKEVTLTARTKAANNWGADLYLAIHHNAGVSGGYGGGIVGYVYTKPLDESVKWRNELYHALIATTGLEGNRATPMQKANLHEVREPRMPAVLLELGFMDSKTDVPIILSEKYADQCAQAIVKVLVERGNLTRKASGVATAPAKPAVKVDAAKSFKRAKAGTYVVNASDGLNLRTGASTAKTKIKTLPNGDTVTCYGYYTGDWLYVKAADGAVGYCHSGYLKKR